MNPMHKRLEELLFHSANQSLEDAERAELNALLRENPDARAFAAKSLTIDAMLAENLAAIEARQNRTIAFPPQLIASGKSHTSRPNWLAKAAIWIGAVHLFGNTAKAATTASATTSTTLITQSTIIILMKKTVTSITAAILVLGGSGIYLIHRSIQSSQDRIATMESEIQSLSGQLGISTTRSLNQRAAGAGIRKAIGITQIVAIYDDHVITPQEWKILDQFEKQLATMDAEELTNLLLDAEKISRIDDHLALIVMNALIPKDPAGATQIATQLIGRAYGYQFQFSCAAGRAFDAWMQNDPTAADAWFTSTVAAGGFHTKFIPDYGLEHLALDRSFNRSRVVALAKTNPAEAAAIIANMLPGDATTALKEITDPNALGQILPVLKSEQRVPAGEGAISAMAANDPDAAFAWAKSLGLSDRQRDTLMAKGIEAAVSSGKMNLSEVAEWSKKLSLAPDRRSELQVEAAVNSSYIKYKDRDVTDWNRAADRIAWLRQEAPPEMANEMVGQYLGKVTRYGSDPHGSYKLYEQEVARMGGPDAALTIAYTDYLSRYRRDEFKVKALEYLKQLPDSPEKNQAIAEINNR